MCDCPQEEADEVADNVGPETVTIFTHYPTMCCPATDWMPVDSVQSNSSQGSWNSVKGSSASTESSSGSSTTYKFVCPTECACSGEAEKGDSRPPSVCLETYTIQDAVEKESDIEYTLAMIKPEAIVYREEIEHRMYVEGFEICQRRYLRLTPEQTSEFYHDRFGEPSFPRLVAYVSSGPVLVYVLAKQNAVEEWKTIIGPSTVTEARLYYPDSIRARYGRKGDSFKNAVHGSGNRERAEEEIHFFFPEFITEPLLRDEKAEDFLWDVVNPILVEGLILCCKSKPADPVLWLANWLITNNPNKPKLPEDLALIPT